MGSVWLAEIDNSLINTIKTIVKTMERVNGEIVPVPVDAFVRNPEGVVQIAKYPCVTIFNYDVRFAGNRFDPSLIRGQRADGRITLEQPALPYDLYYQVDFWAKYNEDINEMLRRWHGTIGKNHLLEVLDTEGNQRFSSMTRVDSANADYAKGDQRIFHRVFSYKIWVELDERLPIQVPYATAVQVDKVQFKEGKI